MSGFPPPPGYPSEPPTAGLPQPVGSSPDPAGPATGPGGGSPRPGRKGLLIGLGALAAALVIAIATVASPESNSPRLARAAGADGPVGTPTTVTVTDEAWAPVRVEGAPLPWGGTHVGETAPTIVGESFDGSEVRIEPGEPTVVIVMAHWCPHCQAEIPRVVEAWITGQLPEGVRVVGLASANDPARGNFPPSRWLANEGWPFRVMVDDRDQGALAALAVEGFPTMIAIDAGGTVRAHESGERTLDELQAIWSAALGAESN